MKIIELDEVKSTNEYCKALQTKEDVLVFAKRQTGGMGTKVRSVSSDIGGVYVSYLRLFSSFPAKNAFELMQSACVAVCKTLERFGAKPQIRWPNDVLCLGRKISGTLIENTLSGDNLIKSIIGIGINVSNALPDELNCTAITLKEVTGEENEQAVKDELIKNIQNFYTRQDYISRISWLGEQITVYDYKDYYKAEALRVTPSGALEVKAGKITKILNFGEVTIRL